MERRNERKRRERELQRRGRKEAEGTERYEDDDDFSVSEEAGSEYREEEDESD